MVGRLGNVLYWTACAFAVAWSVTYTSIFLLDRHTPTEWISGSAIAGGGALLIWVIGRACRYVLAGR